MNNTTEISDLLKRDGVLTEEIKEESKPYTMRKLSSKDLSPMLKVLKKLNFKKLKDVFKDINLKAIIEATNNKNNSNNDVIADSEEDSTENVQETSQKEINLVEIGKDVIFDMFPILLDSIDEAIPEINKLLAGVIEQDVKIVENMDLGTYFNLLYDFIHKEEFMDFIKVASRFMK